MAVTLEPVDEPRLERLVAAACADADADEVTPRVTDGPAWTPERVAWLRAFHRDRRAGLDGPLAETTWAVVADGEVVGGARLQRASGTLEAGVWLVRAARGRGVGRTVLAQLVDAAGAAGARRVVAETRVDNRAALAVLHRAGFRTADERTAAFLVDLDMDGRSDRRGVSRSPDRVTDEFAAPLTFYLGKEAGMTADDEAMLATAMDRHRRELHVHCYRMLGSFDDAEDAVQETFVRAWRARDGFDGGPDVRAWLYRIATNTCLDAIRRTNRRAAHGAEVSWLTPYPDRLLDLAAPADEQPDVVAVARETVELAYLAVIQLLPARQRAVLLLRDVLGWSAADTAAALELTVPAANSALQRARATLHDRLPERDAPSRTDLSPDERALLMRYIAAHETGDVAAAVELMRDDIRVTMPPYPWRYEGIPAVAELVAGGTGANGPGEWILRPTSANRLPAAACYLREPGATEARLFKIDVIRLVRGRIAEITTFGPELGPQFGLPPVL